MEAVGLIVAITQIVEKLGSFCLRVKHANGAIQDVEDKLSFIALHSSVIGQIIEENAYNDIPIPQNQRALFQKCLFTAKNKVESISNECQQIVAKASGRKGGRLSFAAWNHKHADDILQQLNSCESSLNAAVTLLRL
jgi:hypothetical protein